MKPEKLNLRFDKKTTLVNHSLISKEAVELYLEKEIPKLIKKMIRMYVINYEKTSKNKVQDNNDKKNKYVMCGIHPCIKQLKIVVRCSSRTNIM